MDVRTKKERIIIKAEQKEVIPDRVVMVVMMVEDLENMDMKEIEIVIQDRSVLEEEMKDGIKKKGMKDGTKKKGIDIEEEKEATEKEVIVIDQSTEKEVMVIEEKDHMREKKKDILKRVMKKEMILKER